jgi:hypothetical protein
MATDPDSFPPLLAYAEADHSYAKKVLAVSILIQVGSMLSATLLPLFGQPGYALVVTISVLAIVAYLLRWYSDTVRSAADAVFRKIEYEQCLGWQISEKETRDVRAKGDEAAARKLNSDQSSYWASQEPCGPRRAAESTQESAWWSEHLAKTMGGLVAVIAALFLTAGIVALFVVLGADLPSTTAKAAAVPASTTAKAILSVMSVTFTGGFMRMTIDYFTFSKAANAIDTRALALLKQSTIELTDAVRLLNDYQLVRAKSPPLSDTIRWIRKGKLNRVWNSARQPTAVVKGPSA